MDDDVELLASREAVVGNFHVRRALPRRQHRTVGAWCFADHMGPAQVTETASIDIGPHPHIGLQTVTWLVAGEILHKDSLGSEQVVRAGELNLMTAGGGVAHSEEATGGYRGELHGIQLWVAQPESTRHGAAAFEHHRDLPRTELDGWVATVLVGGFAGAASPARRDTDHFGADIVLAPRRCAAPVARDHEHALVVLDGQVILEGVVVEPGKLAYVGPGRDELVLEAGATGARALLLGGRPFPEAVLMWWNFVARDHDEIEAARRQWEARDPRFGSVASLLARIAAPSPLPTSKT